MSDDRQRLRREAVKRVEHMANFDQNSFDYINATHWLGHVCVHAVPALESLLREAEEEIERLRAFAEDPYCPLCGKQLEEWCEADRARGPIEGLNDD